MFDVRLSTSFVFSTILLAVIQAGAGLYAQTRVRNESFPASPGDSLVIQDDAGRVRIRTWDASEVQARIELNSPGKPEQGFDEAAQKSGREIFLYSFFTGHALESVNLDIRAPKFINVIVWGANPEVELEGVEGSVRVQNIGGTISVSDSTSSVTLTSMRGDIVYRAGVQPRGDVRLESTSGDVLRQLAAGLNFRAWLRAGGSVTWDQKVQDGGGVLEKQLGSFGPMLDADSLQGNVRVSLLPAGGPTPATSASEPARTPTVASGAETAQPAKAAARQSAGIPGSPATSPQSPEASAQSTSPSPGGGVSIKVNVDTVLLNVSVRDRGTNRSIAGLQKDDFRVYENGVQQQIQQLLPTEAPFNLLLLLDVSGSTASYIQLMQEAATEFTRQINEKDRIAVAEFNSRFQLLQDFAGDRAAAAQAIRRIRSGGGTAFYDALMTCVDRYMSRVEGRKAIVVFTDGVDNQLLGNFGEGSRMRFNELFRRIQESDTIIYTIFLDSEGQVPTMTRVPSRRYPRPGQSRMPFPLPFPVPGGSPFPSPYPSPVPSPIPRHGNERAAYETAREQLASIAEQTGGRMYTPARAEDLAGTYSQIADDLRIQYLLAYASSDPTHDGRWRSIDVEVTGHPDAVVRTRKGYYASAGPAQTNSSR